MSAPIPTPQELSDQITCLNVQYQQVSELARENKGDIEGLKTLTAALTADASIQPSADEIYSLQTAAALILSASEKPGSGPSGSTEGSVTVQSPCKFKKVLAVVLTIIALIAIAVLIACIIAACGGFPLLLSALNLYTIGACVSLPIIASTSVALICLCTFVANSLIKPVITVRTTR